LSVQQTIETRCGISHSDVVDTVLDLPSIAVVLSFDTSRLIAALSRSGFVDAPDRLRTCVIGGHDLLAAVSQFLFLPNDGLKEPLQSSGCDVLIQRDRFDVLSLHVREQPPHVCIQQCTPLRPSETAGEASQKLGEQFPQLCDILN
jgi:hypothetical protein